MTIGGVIMAQHFLNSAKLRDFKSEEIDNLTETEAHHYFANLRWGISGKQVCPSCGTVDNHYWRKQRRHWRCRSKGCEKEFSATQGTAFHGHKLPVKKILKAIFLYITEMKGFAAFSLMRKVSMSYKAAWVLLSKIRESFFRNRDMSQLKGTVHADGAYFCGKRRDANQRGASHKDKTSGIQSAVYVMHGAAPSGRQRRAKNFLPGGKANAKRRLNRRVILVVRELSLVKGEGAVKTRVTVVRKEQESEVMPFILRYVEKEATIMTDENPAYNQSSSNFNHKTVQHSKEYQTIDGVNNNQAESFNSRMRRAEYGIYHGFSNKYLMFYLCEFAWLEDHRRNTLRERFIQVAQNLTRSGRSLYFHGYWQGNHLKKEILNA